MTQINAVGFDRRIMTYRSRYSFRRQEPPWVRQPELGAGNSGVLVAFSWPVSGLACRHQADADLQKLVDEDRGDVRSATGRRCGSRLSDGVCAFTLWRPTGMHGWPPSMPLCTSSISLLHSDG